MALRCLSSKWANWSLSYWIWVCCCSLIWLYRINYKYPSIWLNIPVLLPFWLKVRPNRYKLASIPCFNIAICALCSSVLDVSILKFSSEFRNLSFNWEVLNMPFAISLFLWCSSLMISSLWWSCLLSSVASGAPLALLLFDLSCS